MKRTMGIAIAQTPGTYLTKDEADILSAVKRGLTNSQIAAARGTRPQTVKNQMHVIYIKTGAKSRAELLSVQLKRA